MIFRIFTQYSRGSMVSICKTFFAYLTFHSKVLISSPRLLSVIQHIVSTKKMFRRVRFIRLRANWFFLLFYNMFMCRALFQPKVFLVLDKGYSIKTSSNYNLFLCIAQAYLSLHLEATNNPFILIFWWWRMNRPT